MPLAFSLVFLGAWLVVWLHQPLSFSIQSILLGGKDEYVMTENCFKMYSNFLFQVIMMSCSSVFSGCNFFHWVDDDC